jgi:raffinose/stachyose/melibiose transport system permease protein
MLEAFLSRKNPSEWIRWVRITRKVLLTILLLGFTFLVIIPFLWMLLMSVKTTSEILLDPYGLPQEFRWDNYVRLFTNPDIRFQRYFYNSIFVTFFAILICTLLSTLAGYGFSRKRYTFKFRSLLFSILLLAIMLPPQILYIPQFAMMAKYGLVNTRWSLVLIYAAAGLPMSIFILSSYFSQLPSEMEDAALIDGCNDIRMFWQVMLPLARPAVTTVILLNFLRFWNELLLSLSMITKPELRTVPSAIMMFIGEHRSEFGMAASSLVITMIPVLILYIFLSETFIEGMVAGALKG